MSPDAGAPPSRRSRATAALLAFVAVAWPYAVAGGAALVVAVWTFRPWKFGTAAMNPSGDAVAFVAWVQNIVETGWYENGERLAAPFAQNSHSYTLTDELLLALIGKVIAPLTGSAGSAVTWWVTVSIPLTAVAGVALARYLGISRIASVLPGFVFAILPDTLMRANHHFSLANTWTLPIGLLAAVSLVHLPRQQGRRRIVWEAALLVGLAAVTLTSAYYAVFSGILIVAAGLGAFWMHRRWSTLALTGLRGAALGVPLVVTVLLDRAFLPSPLGYEAFAVTRTLYDAEYYAGKITAMLLPAPGHRVPVLNDIRLSYDSTFPPPAEGPALGVVAAVGFVGLVIWAVLSHWRPRGFSDHPVLATLSGLTWVALFGYVVGGLGTIWALLLDGGGIRVWSRMHVVIALLALLAVAVTLDRLRPHWRAGLVAVLLVVAAFDQTRPGYRPSPDAARAVEAEVRDLTDRIAADAGPEAAVFQFPQINFPLQNRPLGRASAYDGFIPYLYSDALRWSYGGLQGDPVADWQLELAERPLADQLVLLEAAGFAGMMVDTAMLADSPDEIAELDVLGAATITSSSERWLYYAFDDAPDESTGCTVVDPANNADLAVRPPLLYGGDGFEVVPGAWTNDEGDAALRIVTLRPTGWDDVTASFTLENPATWVQVGYPDGTVEDLGPGVHPLSWTGDVAAPETQITITRLEAVPGVVTVTALDADVQVPLGRVCPATDPPG